MVTHEAPFGPKLSPRVLFKIYGLEFRSFGFAGFEVIWGFRGFYRSKVRGFALSVLGIGFPFISATDSLLLLTLFSPTIIFCSVVSTIYTSMPYVANSAVHFPADCQPVIFFCCHYFTNGPERAEYCARRSVGIAQWLQQRGWWLSRC